ncbi:hypothetical protein ACP4OV_005631 [Aristida adscensionis]
MLRYKPNATSAKSVNYETYQAPRITRRILVDELTKTHRRRHYSAPANLLLDDHARRAAAALCSPGVLHGGEPAMAELPPPTPGGESYLLESQGELLCVAVQYMPLIPGGRPVETPAWMSVHALEVHDDDGRPPEWVKREHGRGIDDMCMFLNGGSSAFAIDARELAGAEDEAITGGCAYVVVCCVKSTAATESVYGVCRYSFKDGTAKVVHELPAPFDRSALWYTPRPMISPLRSPRA